MFTLNFGELFLRRQREGVFPHLASCMSIHTKARRHFLSRPSIVYAFHEPCSTSHDIFVPRSPSRVRHSCFASRRYLVHVALSVRTFVRNTR